MTEELSPRQLEVLRLVADGLTLLGAAERLEVQLTTVKTHLDEVFRKLDAHSQAEAVHRAHQMGILT